MADEAARETDAEVEGHGFGGTVEEVVEEVVEATSDEEPDVEAHGWGSTVEEVVEEVVE